MTKTMRVLMLGLILFAAAVAYASMPSEDLFMSSADEGFYVQYARAVSEQGLGKLPEMFGYYMSSTTNQQFPHPGRVGHVLITSLWYKIFPHTFRSLAHLSFVCFLLFLGASFFFGRKAVGIDAALGYTLLLASSPLMMAASRRTLQDSLLNLFWALPFWFFFDYLTTKKRSMFIAWAAVFSVAMTIKEASVPLWLFFIIAWVVFKFRYQRDLPAVDLVYLCIPPFAAAGLYMIFLGGLNNFITLIDYALGLHYYTDTASFSYAYPAFATGPWYKFLVDFLLLSPFVTLLFVGYFFHLVMTKKFDPIRSYAMIFFLFVFLLFSNMQHTKIVRFVMSLDIVMCLFAVFALYEIFSFNKRALAKSAVLASSFFLIFFANIMNYSLLYVSQNIYDPISVWLFLAKKFLPYFKF